MADEERSMVAASDDLDAGREDLMKGFIVSQEGIQDSNARQNLQQGTYSSFADAGAIEPRIDPESLARLFEHSNSLRQNVDAYRINVDGFGHRFDPVLDPDSMDARKRVADAIVLGRIRDLEVRNEGLAPEKREELSDEDFNPSDAEVDQLLKDIEREARLEKFKLESFFESVSLDTSFVGLRKKTRQDLEVTGNGYWEILRNQDGQLAEFVFLPSYTMRLMPSDKNPVPDVESKVRRTALTIDTVKRRRRFRRYVQVCEGTRTFFKELGDPRTLSATSGQFYKDEKALKKEEEDEAVVATEVLHFKIESPRSAYGVPRWIGNLISVLGSRSSEEVNHLYFENKAVPPMAIIVSGGRATKGTVDRIGTYLEQNMKGIKNFHRILMIEGESGPAAPGMGPDTSGRMRIELKSLMDAQQKDALFQGYDEANRDKVGESFRVPRILRANTKDFNRATAEAALSFAESQVFQPERSDFDWIMDTCILVAELGIKYWRFQSNDPVTRNPTEMSTILKDLVGAGVLFIEEARVIAGDIFNSDLAKTGAWWARVPVPMALASVVTEVDAPSRGGDDDGPGATPAPAKDPEKPEPPEGNDAPDDGKPKTPVAQQAAAAGALRKKYFEDGEVTLDTISDAHDELVAMRKTAEPAIVAETQRLRKVRDALADAEVDESSARLDDSRDDLNKSEPDVVYLDKDWNEEK